MKIILNNQIVKSISENLLKWYRLNFRSLPWRETKDPYFIWLSEIILQQTRVIQGTPYYLIFSSNYPDIQSFANANLDEILKKWQGLGYYSRARNMHTCAQEVLEQYGGTFPNNYQSLLKLKGIGKYTAGAIASISFNEAVPAIDGNAYRVYSRLFGIYLDTLASSSFSYFFDIGKKIIDQNAPGDFNQAIMELGATICAPKNAKCDQCPIIHLCYANAQKVTNELPIKIKKIKIKERYFEYFVCIHNDQVLMHKRETGDIWTGLHEFLLIETKKTSKISNFDSYIDLSNFGSCTVTKTDNILLHKLTHQNLHISFCILEFDDMENFENICQKYELIKVNLSSIEDLAVPKPVEQFIRKDLNIFNN